ncbi:tetratricopeptide repeat protein [Chloroflexota bacterium]
MTNEEEKPARLKKQLSDQAITLAMQGRWQEAIDVNRRLIESFAEDVNAYNRLGRACMELGDYTQAREAYGRAMEVDPYNAIAKKNIQRLSSIKESVKTDSQPDKAEPQHFIEEIGKAAVVNLFAPAPWEIRARMVAGDKISLKVEGSSLLAENGSGEYQGQVDQRHALRLIRLMEGGNKYSAAVVSSTEEAMAVIIRETYQEPGQVGRLSFPPKGTEAVQTYAGDRIIKLQAEYDREADEESGYTIIGGDEVEVLTEENGGGDEESASEEE